MSRKINLNADLGESYGAWVMGNDADMLPLVGSANLLRLPWRRPAGHAPDPATGKAATASVSAPIRPTRPAKDSVGAAWPWRRPNWRRPSYQIAALDGMARVEGLRVSHVKPHGALNNAACADRGLADTIVRAIRPTIRR